MVRLGNRHEGVQLGALVAVGLLVGYGLVRLVVVGAFLVVLGAIVAIALRRWYGLAVVAAATALGGLAALVPTILASPICPATTQGKCHSNSTEMLAALLATVLVIAAGAVVFIRVRDSRRTAN